MGNFSYDESEFESQEAAEEALASLEESPAPTVIEDDPALADVDLRLETADYYRAILNHDFFDVASTAAQIVDREIRTFIRERLEVLLGLRSERQSEQQAMPFEEDEIQALKLLASKVLRRPGIVAEAPVKKMATPVQSPAPQAKPVVKAKPQAKKIPAPPPAPSTKPKAKQKMQPAKKADPVPVVQVQAPPAESNNEPKVGGVTQTFIDHKSGKEVTLVEGEIIEEKGQKFIVAVNERGTLYRKNITGQVAPAHRHPPMTPQQMSIMSQQQAEQQLRMVDEQTGLAIVASLQGS